MPAQVLVPPLREMEAYVFDQMVRLLWRTLVEVRPGCRVHCLRKTSASWWLSDTSIGWCRDTACAGGGCWMPTKRHCPLICDLADMQLYAPLVFQGAQSSQDSTCLTLLVPADCT